MSIRVLINGAYGKMGQLAVKTLQNNADFSVVGTTGSNDHLADEIKNSQAQVVLDLTKSSVVLENTQTIIEAGAHPVIGTSGLLAPQIEELQKRCAQLKLGGIIVPNFSLGAVLVMKQAQEIASYFPQVEIIEMHHDGKLDSPSGTAVRAADMLALKRGAAAPLKPSHETVPGARGAVYQGIPIHAVRLPGMVAHLQIMFGGLGETVTLRHDTIDRECFMPGVVLACRKVMGLTGLVYGLENVL